ncbi:MAG: VanW family protein [Lachnospiraceae bacterium]|nr:VanW family protein [Lachnospiraceae bacterium]
MQKIIKVSKTCLLLIVTALFIAFITVSPIEAKAKDTILSGIYVDDISLGGKTAEEAMELVKDYVAGLGQKGVTLNIVNGFSLEVTPDELGFTWSNPEIIEEAAALGQKGNIIARYKAIKDLEHSNKVYEVKYSFDSAMIFDIIADQCADFNQPAIDARMELIDGERIITEGQAGYEIDIRASVDLIIDFMDNYWDKNNVSIDLIIAVAEPRGSYEELSGIIDVLGTFSTAFSGSSSNRIANIANGTRLCSGILLYPGDEFDALKAVTPFTEANGYELAGSFLQGQLVDSLGGGICQVTTTLYIAALYAELEISERHNHSMIVSYVEPSMDAAIAESSGKNLRFINNTEAPIFVEGRTTSDRRVIFTIYGKEFRPANRVVEYQSEVLETRVPEGERVFQDAGFPVGYISVQSAYIGYRSRLWKVVKEDGIEISREEVNRSSYIAVPRTATVGTFTNDGAALAHIFAAIDTNNIDHIKNVAAHLQAQAYIPPPHEEAHPDDHEW